MMTDCDENDDVGFSENIWFEDMVYSLVNIFNISYPNHRYWNVSERFSVGVGYKRYQNPRW